MDNEDVKKRMWEFDKLGGRIIPSRSEERLDKDAMDAIARFESLGGRVEGFTSEMGTPHRDEDRMWRLKRDAKYRNREE